MEFEDKKIAKHVAACLNNTPLGGKGYYKEDIWNIKYLSKFKWEHLTEKNGALPARVLFFVVNSCVLVAAYEKRIREQRLKMEVSQARREDSSFLDDVEQAKRISYAKKKVLCAHCWHCCEYLLRHSCVGGKESRESKESRKQR